MKSAIVQRTLKNHIVKIHHYAMEYTVVRADILFPTLKNILYTHFLGIEGSLLYGFSLNLTIIFANVKINILCSPIENNNLVEQQSVHMSNVENVVIKGS